MCGRYTLLADLSRIQEDFHLDGPLPPVSLGPQIVPGREILAVIGKEGHRYPLSLTWGLIPAWMRESPKTGGFINARAETVATKASFRQAFRYRRCLIVADGFYEWEKREGRRKRPWLYTLRSGAPFAFAGVYEEEPRATGAIITTPSNELIAPIHDRMPAILPPNRYDFWLDPTNRQYERLQQLLVPYPAEEMVVQPAPPLAGRTIPSPRSRLHVEEG